MSNLSDDTLRKILEQIQTQAVVSQRSLNVARAQIQAKEKEKKILQLTMRELGTMPPESKMYKGVGKMFMAQPRAAITAEQTAQDKALNEDLSNLTKKASLSAAPELSTDANEQAKYLEKQFDEANGQLRDIFRSQQRQA